MAATMTLPALPAWATGPSLEPTPMDGSVPITDAMLTDSCAWGDGLNRFHGPAAKACCVLDRTRQTASEGWVTDRHHAGTDDLADHEVWQAARWSPSYITTGTWGTWVVRRWLSIPAVQAPATFAAGVPGVLMYPLGYEWRGWDGDPAAMLDELRGVVWEMEVAR